VFAGTFCRLLVNESKNILIEANNPKTNPLVTKNPLQESMKNHSYVQWLTLVASLYLALSSTHAQQPPSTDRVLWLKADVGLTLGTNLTVQKWADQAGGVLNDAVPYGAAAPHVGEVTFANGPQPAIIFNGQQGFNLANPTDLDLTNLSVYVVASISQTQSSTIMIATYAPVSGWALGITDFSLNHIKWFSPGQSLEPAAAELLVDTSAIITATYSNDTKSLYLNTTLMDSVSGVGTPSYATGHQLTVGTLAGGSQSLYGAIAEILVYSSSSDSQRNSVEQYLQRKYFGSGTGPVAITSGPASQTVTAGNSAAFAVAVDGAPPITFQWRTNGVPIPGATNIDYLISTVTTNDAASYSVAVTNSSGGIISTSAVLTVNSDLTPPQVLAAGRDFNINTTVVVTFSEPVSAASATNAGNYKINNGVTISSAVLDAAASVVLTTSPITYGPAYTLTVTNVEDLAANKIAPNSTVPLQVSAPLAATPPTTDMVLWFKADAGVATGVDGVTITGWTDQAPGGNDNSSDVVNGTPKLKEAYFPSNGFHQVVRLDGTAAFHLQNAADADLQVFSVYVVGSVANNNQGGEIFISDWPGMALGISDAAGGVPKYVTFNGGVNSLEPAAAKFSNSIPAQLTMTFTTNGNSKAAYQNGKLLATATTTISYSGGELTLGRLSGDGQNLNGDIAEVILYSSVSASQRAAVDDYLGVKYFGGPVLPTLLSAQRDLFQATSVAVEFSELVSAATATNTGNYFINQGIVINGASLGANGTTVTLTTTTPLSSSVSYTLTVNSVQDAGGNAIAPSSQVAVLVPLDPVRQQYNDGAREIVSLEAEHYNFRTSGGGHDWIFTTLPPTLLPTDANTNFSGVGAMYASPNSGLNVGTLPLGTSPTGTPRMDYAVQFTNSGTFYVWIRAVADSAPGASANDSVMLGLDGVLTTRLTGFPGGQGYVWGNTAVGDSGPITVNSTGNHTINVWMREDGFVADRILLTSDNGFTPSGFGPAESAAVPAIAPVTLTVARSGANLILSWPGAGILQSATNVAGPYADIIGSASPYNVTPSGAATFYRVRQ